MAVHFETDSPAALLKLFDERIAQTAPQGKITTWQKVGGYYTHRADQWTRKAWFTAVVHQGVLTFNIVRTDGTTVQSRDYAYYHGHLIETFLAHFDKIFSGARASALAEVGDRISAAA